MAIIRDNSSFVSLAALVLLSLASVASATVYCPCNSTCTSVPGGQSVYDFAVPPLLGGANVSLAQYAGNVTLVVNVASFWGETVPNYSQFPLLKAKFPVGFEILGFPCAQFDNQEPGDQQEILNCLKYVRPGGGYVPNFPIFGKIPVNGGYELPLFSFLKSRCPASSPYIILGGPNYIDWTPVRDGDIAWNFEKFLVNQKGFPVKRYDTTTNPLLLENDIAALLRGESLF